MLMLLAQSSADKHIGPMLIQLGLLIGLVVFAGLILLLFRKWMFSRGDQPATGSMLDDLRRLRDSGEISEVEYDYLRRCIANKAAGKEAPPRPAELAPTELRARPGFDLTGQSLPPEVLRAMERERRNGA
ncbi:MAG: hypothetical protein DYG94_07840 [Leptolyngbya sp. PLA3]|nr:MAG: hypothetical protein EDM82_10250 [Cyanobacteria bacterium CYA]MCE7968642.1 hypothetical protein [Leptolyngbya sp. PL-A3]